MKASNAFEKTIQNYLEEFAQKDSLFQAKLDNKEKSLSKCCDYIAGEIQKRKVSMVEDQEVFDLAVHYYDETDLKVSAAPKYSVVVPASNEIKVELTAEEIKEAEQKARDKAIMEVMQNKKNAMLNKAKKTKPEAEQSQGTLELF